MIKKIKKHIDWLINSMLGLFTINKYLNNNTYVFISHNSDNSGGAPVVLYELIKSLNIANCVFLSPIDGDLKYELKKSNIHYFCIYKLEKIYFYFLKRNKVKFIEFNTITMTKYLKYFYSTQIPIYFWIHEEKNILNKYIEQFNNCITKCSNNIHIIAVSERVKNDILECCPNFSLKIEIMYYGCEDCYLESTYSKKDKFLISCIGRICKRKNQLEILQAYSHLPSEVKNKIIIKFISGSADKEYLTLLENFIQANKIDNIIFEGPFNRKEMIEKYNESDLIICSSIDDPLPVVVTEALMLKRIVITSSQTGQYSLISNNYNGYTYEVNNIKELKNQILKIYKLNLNQIEIITNNGRDLFLNNFSINACNKKFLKIVGGN